MDLLDRYLANVAVLLPAQNRDDIVAELRDILLSQMEDRQAVLGGSLTETQQEAVIQAFGHPLIVASRYRPDQYLVGPTLYPFWLFTLQLGAGIIFCLALLFGVLHAIQVHNPLAAVPKAIGYGVPTFLILIGATTLWAVILERTAVARKITIAWKPSRLPVVAPRRKSSFELAVEVVFGAVFILIWAGITPIPRDFPTGTGQLVHVGPAPVWARLYLPILAVLIARLFANLLELSQLGRAFWRQAYALAVSVAGFVVLALILGGGHWLDLMGLPEPAERAIAGVNLGIRIALICGLVGAGIEIAWSSFKLWRLRRR